MNNSKTNARKTFDLIMKTARQMERRINIKKNQARSDLGDRQTPVFTFSHGEIASLLQRDRKVVARRAAELVATGVISRERLSNNNFSYSLEAAREVVKSFGKLLERPEGEEALKLAVANFKGGATKTTTTLYLALVACISLMTRLKVLVVDTDPQASLTQYLLDDFETSDRAGFGDLLMIEAGFAELPDSSFDYASACYDVHIPGLSILPARINDNDFEINMLTGDAVDLKGCWGYVNNIIDRIMASRDFDLILFDTTPQINATTISVLYAANAVLIPLQALPNDVDSTQKFFRQFAKVYKGFKGDHAGYHFVKSVLGKHRDGVNEARNDQAKELRAAMGKVLMDACLYERKLIEQTGGHFCTAIDFPTDLDIKTTDSTVKTVINDTERLLAEIANILWALWYQQPDNTSTLDESCLAVYEDFDFSDESVWEV